MSRPHAKQMREAGRLIAESRRPVLYVGGGVVKARAWSELKELAELTGIPVITTLMARGCSPTATQTWACRECMAQSPLSGPCSAATC